MAASAPSGDLVAALSRLERDHTGHDIDRRFWRFHEANPQVYAKLVEFARQAKASGRRRRYSVELLWGRLRWHTAIETVDGSGWKLNDHFTSRYARLLDRQERCTTACDGCARPDCLAGLFELRALHTPSSLEGEAA